MKLYEDLKYIGNDNLKVFEGVWHCTQFVTRVSNNQMEYIIQQPSYYSNGILMGYTGLNTYVFTEEELIRDFKIINKDGSLEDIVFNFDKNNYFNDISDDDINKILEEMRKEE